MKGPPGVSGGYRERASRVGGAVLWARTMQPSARPVLPDGCTDLIWSGGRLLVAGPDTGPQSVDGVPPGTPFVGLRFAPGQGPAVFGVPARELRDRRVPLADLWPAGPVRELTERLAAAGEVGGAGRVGRLLEEAAGARLREGGAEDGRVGAVVAALGRGCSVGEVARAVALSERQLHRLGLDAFGYGPKTLTRVLRLVRALDLARAGMPYAQVAARAGFADQAHLAREVKSLAGAPMGVLLAPG
ncbi:helix-turn-helix domain-containing protein [Streptomyces tubercidicus]|uniref:helix-turn-helix transcriptional regulator n=1 Tax=Streptomyces tubercidicus TaxID=47759 RepID=UPI002E145557|nr:helix-turn-helix transcriptional regulator [Streptomyces tubercidicus]WSX25332.1 helix-turn-helix transcriptional regulator [Streptomyces tubercidicus]